MAPGSALSAGLAVAATVMRAPGVGATGGGIPAPPESDAVAPDPFLCASSIARKLMTAELCLEAQRARSDVVLVRTADGAAQSYAKKCVWFAPQIARIARSAC